jgi:3-hydroxymyristoyl/3-hydroxydecanoyl-(acyl carrier protein) dehydratase
MLHIPNELIYFKGHFPDQAILPGVVQLDWAIGFAQSVFALEPHVVGAIKQLKFSQIIHPNQDVCLRLDHNMDAFATRFKYESDAGIHASGIISWKTHV